MADIHTTDQSFEQDVLKSDQPVLVDFWAPWCGPCIMMGPVIEELAKDTDGTARVLKLNVDENQQAASQYGVSSIPTIIFFKGGHEVDRVVGVKSKDELKQKLENLQ